MTKYNLIASIKETKRDIPLKKINKQNLAIKNTKEGSIFINNSLVANKYFKYTKTVYLERVIKNLQFNGKYIQK